MHDAGVVRLRGRGLGCVSRRAGEGGVRELGVLGGGLCDVSSWTEVLRLPLAR